MGDSNTIDFLVGLFGYGRARFPQESNVTDAIFSVFEDLGAVKRGENGVPGVFDNYYFRIKGRQVKMSVEEYGDITLWGPKRIVRDLSNRISDRILKHR